MSSEAGPSSTPLFKKRSKSHTTTTTSRISSSVILDPHPTPTQPANAVDSTHTTPAAVEQEQGNEISVQDLIALRSLARKPTGIELDRLNKGDKNNKKKTRKQNDKKSAAEQEEERWQAQMKHGGLMAGAAGGDDDDDDVAESEEEDGSKARSLVRKNNFQGETGTVDVDKHMMAYIEEEMKKRTGGRGIDSSLNQAEIQKAVNNPQDDLYALAERYKELQRSIKPEQTQEEREGNVALSAAMLSSIPEVDLGIDSRMKNIEDTERAKREFYDRRKKEDASDAQVADEAFASARFQRQRPRMNNSDFHHHHRPSDSSQGGGGGSGNRGERKQMATDQLVLDRFRKRQRNFR